MTTPREQAIERGGWEPTDEAVKAAAMVFVTKIGSTSPRWSDYLRVTRDALIAARRSTGGES